MGILLTAVTLALLCGCSAARPVCPHSLPEGSSAWPERASKLDASGQLLFNHDHSLHFQVIGDWGRQGEWNQSDVADAMANDAKDNPPAFVLSTGDNFYPSGLNSTDDVNFRDTFIDVYHQPELQVPWLAVLGNHDYGDGIGPLPDCPRDVSPDECSAGPLPQLSVKTWERDQRWSVRRSRVISLAGGALDIFMYDTTPFITEYYDRDWSYHPGSIREQSWRANLVELEAELAASDASWKVVVGHHPVRSNGGEHGDTPELREHVEPLLERYGVQLYLAGHDHDLEHIKEDGAFTHHIVSGAGSQTRDMIGDADALFQHGRSGFVTITVRRDKLAASFFGLRGKQPMYIAHIPREPADALDTAAGGAHLANADAVLGAESEGHSGPLANSRRLDKAAAKEGGRGHGDADHLIGGSAAAWLAAES